MPEVLASILAPYALGEVTEACDSSTRKVEAGGAEVQGQVSLGYIAS